MTRPKPICKRCQGLIFNKEKHAKYCDKCAIEVQKEYNKAYMKKYMQKLRA